MPIKTKRLAFTPVTGSATNIKSAGTPGGAGALTLDGALVSGGVVPAQNMAYMLLFTTTADDSAKTITIVGTDADGAAQTEALTAPNATTKQSTKYYKSISSISVSAGFTGNLSIGTSNATSCAVSQTVLVDSYSPYTTLAADISGTINFTLQKCYENPNRGETPNWVTAQAAGTVDVQTLITGPVAAVRLLINSYTNTATAALTIMQSDC